MNRLRPADDVSRPAELYVSTVENRSKAALALDLGLVLCFGSVAEWNTWVFGTVGGPRWLTTLLPLLLVVPLLWRRSRPLLSMALVTTGLVLQAIVSGDAAEGLQNFSVAVAAYSVAAYAGPRRALIGLGIVSAGYGIYALDDRNIRSGRTSELYAGAFYGAVFIVAWLVGSFVRGGRTQKALETQAAGQRRAAELAVADERSRLARELHDIVSHNLSVVVLQAGGARAQGSAAAPAALEKIERSGREALFEMRRLLGVLRGDDEVATVAPQPGLAQLAPLVDRVRAAGLPVEVSIDGDRSGLSPALELSVYRIVQEALTNVLKHAGPATARVDIRCGEDAVTIEVADDGCGSDATPSFTGHGLVGMQERVALFGGSLDAIPGADGGFVVRARLPLAAGAA